MSESETTGVGDSSMDGEKVKAINGMKEVEDVRRMQNGETEKPQINGDVEKSGEGDGETGGGGGGGEAELGERNGSMEDVEMRDEEGEQQETDDMEDVEANQDQGGGGDEGGGPSEEMEEQEEGQSATTSKEEEEEDEEDEEEEKNENGKTAEEKTSTASPSAKEDEEDEEDEEEEEEKVEKETSVEDKKKEDASSPTSASSSSSTITTTTTTSTSSSTKPGPPTSPTKESVNGETTSSTTTTTSSTSTTTPTHTPTKKKKHHSSDDVQEVLPTRQLRARRTPKKYTEDDDDVKITNEVIRDDSSDIEMIEESDPLAISDAEVKKIQKEKKEITIKTKDPNVIIIDTNTLLKNQGNLAAAVAQSTSSTPVQTLTNRSTSTSTTTTTNLNIQSAIQAITGGAPAQGLQSAYITALQQVLLSQGGQVPMNSQHLAQLQQYYNSLGHLQDDAYVIEAPSFIVPYVMEGKPKEPIKEFLKRINKELEEFERKEKEEEERRAAEEKKRKEEEDKQKRKEEREAEKNRRLEAGESIEDLEKEEEEERVAEAKEKEEKEAEEKKKEEGEKKKKEKEEEEEDNKENNKSSTNKEDGKKEGEKDGKVQSKDEKDGERKGREEKATETVDEDKENKDKSDTESVVDLEKEAKEKEDMSFLGKWEPYYRSALGKFMLELGLNQAQEFLQADLLRMQKRKLEKMKTQPSREGIMAVKLLEKQLEVTRKKNAHLQVPLKICKFCTFKTESEMVMERHLESPHMVNYTYKCNFCDFETRGPQVILFHMEAEHNTRGRLERAPAFFQCSLCPYEDNNKSKMTRHSFSCSKKYKPEKNCELLDWEPPAKIPKVLHIHRGRPNTLGKAFEPVKMPSILPKNLAGMNISIQSAGGTNLLPSNTVSIAAGRGRGRPVGSYKNPGPLPSQARGINTVSSGSLLYTNRGTTTTTTVQGSGSQQFNHGNQMFHTTARVQRILPSSSSNSPVSLIPGLGTSSSITIQSVQSKGGNTKSPQQPSISITPLPRAGQQLSQGSGTKGSSTGRGDSGGNPSFVICEICDGYIKDLEQLRNHMNLIHKVKIHPKMIYNRPPLNCQKCQHRFFTDQGLERHLLGTHGLVTSSMQEAANKGKDAGRCPICGKVFQWKLLNHVSRDHKMTLKPAHLSYKCTVCTATFNMYRLFENHVYSAHSVVNKNKEGSKKQSSSGGSSESPLKINDEITIIPQPVVSKSKSSSSNTTSSSTTSSSTSSSSSSDKLSSSKKSDSSTPTMSKEITITKVGSRPTRRSGGGSGGVEVISLDESPKKSENSSSKKRTHKDGVGNNTKKARTSS